MNVVGPSSVRVFIEQISSVHSGRNVLVNLRTQERLVERPFSKRANPHKNIDNGLRFLTGNRGAPHMLDRLGLGTKKR
ncbi:hypothetical protein D1872_250200 [compost metagenome]